MTNQSNSRARNPPSPNAVSSLIESEDQCVVLNEGEAAFLLDTPLEMTQLEELMTNLSSAQIPYTLSDDEETREIIMTWSEGYSDQVEAAMDALGITVLDDNELDAGPDYLPSKDYEGTEFQVESTNKPVIMKPVGEIPVKKLPKKRKKGDMLMKLSTMSQKMHSDGQSPIDYTHVPMLATEAIDRVYYGDDAAYIVDMFIENRKRS